MNILDAKVISTKYGLETYLDKLQSVEVKELHFPTDDNPFYEVLVGVEYLLIKDQKYFNPMKNYFWISMSSDFQTIKLKETDTESLFAVKDNKEKEATKALVGEWLVNTQSFKYAITEWIDRMGEQQENIDSPEIKQFLHNLLHLKTTDIKKAFIEQYSH